jgi:RNA polymerase sigma-70 factor, ECF subfamily
MATSAVTDLRPLMLSIAYRMVGSVSEAEDIVQEAFLRFHRATSAGDAIESPRAWLSTTVTRLAIDHLRSAHVRRETYVGPWLPEPLLADPAPDASRHAEVADTLSLAFLVLLESLTPVERAVFVLHDVFGYGYDEVAEIVGRTEANCRQLAARARRHIEERKPRFEASREQRDELARRFLAAAEEGDTEALVELLAADVAMYGDGGGKAPARATPLHGREKVARFLLGLSRLGERVGIRARPVEVNGQPGALFLDAEGRIVSAMALDIGDGTVQAIRSIVNPDKLGHLGPTGDLTRLLRERGGGATPSG